ncbi:MAG: tail fiber protein [Pseudomonadota bacterium]|nr:tail fiber protein [Pseudomonadota bacterium]
MADPFLGEIRLFSFEPAPVGWARCDGQLLPINQNQALFALLGTMYGGNGQTNFALPDLRGRCAMHVEPNGHDQGERAGQEAHTLTLSEMPQHVHLMTASTLDGDQPIITNALLGAFNNGYTAAASLTPISASTVTNVGGSQPHENMAPYIVINFCIALQGIFPSRN